MLKVPIEGNFHLKKKYLMVLNGYDWQSLVNFEEKEI